MADKSFGVKKIDLLGDGTPTIESPNDLNLNANTVAISTNLSVGNRVSVSSGVVTSISGVVTYYGDGQYLTGITADVGDNLVGTSLSISGISTLGVTSVTDLTAQDLDVSGIASVGAAITMYGATGIISATQYYGDGSKLTGIGAATTANIVAETLKVTGVSTLGVTTITDNFFVSGISTFYAGSNTLNVNTGTTNAAINIQFAGDTKGSLTPKSDGLEIESVGDDDVSVHVNSVGGSSGDFIVKSNGSQLLKIDAGDVKSTFSSDVNVGSAITMYQATGIISATKFFGDGSGLTGAGIGADGSVNTTGIITASAFAGFKYLQAPYGSTVTFTVTVAGKDATHRYNGTGSGNGYLINGVQAPILTLTPGRTYRFTNDNTGSHPFKFYYKADKTTEYTTGVNFQNAYTEITISDTTPNVLHYQCTAHAYMGNAIITNSNVVDSPYPATLRDGLSVSGISSVGSAITMYGTSGIISATKFIGDGSSLTGITADTLGDLATLKVTGLSTFNGNMDINADVDISGALSIGGTLTYEDVTNIDSVGLITARSGIAVLGSGVTVTGLSTFYNDLNVGSGITMISSSGIVSATTFKGSLEGNATSATSATNAAGLTGSPSINVSNIVGTALSVSGIGTIGDTLKVGTAITAHAGIITATKFYGDGSNLTGVGGGTSPGQVSFASTAGISTLTSSWNVVPSGSSDWRFNGPGNLVNSDDPTIYLQRGQVYEFVIDSSSSHPFQIRKTDNTAYTDGVTYTGSGSGSNTVYDGTVRFDVPFNAPSELKYVCTNHAGDMVGVIYVTDAAGQGGPTDVADFQNLKVSAASTLGSVKVSSGIITATSGIVTFYGDGQYLTGITAEGTGAIGGLTVKDEGSTVGTAGSVSTLNFVGDGVVATATAGAAGVATVTIPGFSPTSGSDGIENLRAGTGAGANVDADTCFNVMLGCNAGSTLNEGDGNILLGCNSGCCITSGSYNLLFGSTSGRAVTTGRHNVVMGQNAMSRTPITGSGGDCNIALGYFAGCSLGGGSRNIFLGACAAKSATGYNNIALGYNVELPNAAGNCQLAIGDDTNRWIAGDSSFNVCLAGIATVYASTGIVSATKFCGDGSALTCTKFSVNDSDNNLFAGVGAGGTYAGGSTSCYNLALGCAAMGGFKNTSTYSASHNTAFGCCAGFNLTTGDHNFLGGYQSGNGLTSAGCNIFIGKSSGRCQTTTTGNIYLGFCAGHQATGAGIAGDYNIAFGHKAASQKCGGASSTLNISLGYCAGYKGKGSSNIALGMHSLFGGTFCGSNNIGIGNSTGYGLNDGSDNIILGRCAGYDIKDGCDNITIGRSAGYNIEDTNDNVFVGARAGVWTCNGCRNVMLGSNAGGSETRSSYSTGNYNQFIGYCAGALTCSGGVNLFLGPFAGATNSTGGYNIAIGPEVCLPSATGSCQLAIGKGSDRWITGDSSFNVCLAGSTIKAINSGGVFCATKFVGDGSSLTGIVTVTGINTSTTSTFNDLTVTGVSTFLGSVGIGTTNSNHYNLRVDAGAAKSAFQVVGSTGTLLDVVNDATSDIFSANDVSGINAFKINKDRLITMSLVGAGDSVGIGTTLPRSSSKLDVEGIVKATSFLGDGSTLSNVGFSQDDQGNLVAGTGAGAAKDADTCFNIIMGCNSGAALCGGYGHSILMGCHAGKSITTGAYNFLFGKRVGCSIDTGNGNILIGNSVATSLTTGCKNIAFLGGDSLGATACCNIIMGNEAGYNLTGNSNIALGAQAGCDLTGSDNILLGDTAGTEMTSGSCNIAVGKCAMKSGTVTGNLNIAIGYRSGCAITSATNNVLIGCDAGRSLTSSSALANVFIGRGAGTNAETGCFSVAIGCGTLINMKGLGCNIAFGRRAGENMCTGTHNFFAGNYSAKWTLGSRNIAIGENSLQCFTTTSDSIALGSAALTGSATTTSNTGCVNIALGPDTSKCISTGGCNITIGRYAGCKITTGSQNIAIGKNALLNGTTTGTHNVIIGSDAGCKISSGSYNIAFGNLSAKCLTTGTYNVLVGERAGCLLAGGNYNVFMGRYAGRQVAGGSYNTFIGDESGLGQTAGDCNVIIGHGSRAASTTGGCQLSIGLEANNWIVGNSDYNVGIGTTNPNAAVTSGNTKKLSVGIVSAYQFYGDGSNLTGLAGFSADSQENLYAGTSAGAASDADTCFNIGIGYSAGNALNSGDDNILLGCKAGTRLTSGSANVVLGKLAGQCITSSPGNVIIGCKAACSSTSYSDGSVVIGKSAVMSMNAQTGVFIGAYAGQLGGGGNCSIHIGRSAGYMSSGNRNIFIGHYSGGQNSGGDENIFLGRRAGCNNTSGCYNIVLGCQVNVSSATAKCELAIGVGTNIWICGDSCFNVGIGTNPGDAVGSATTSKLSVGIVSAYQFYGDGSNLTGAGFSADAQENLTAGTSAGNAKDADTCFNIFLGYKAGYTDCAGDNGIYIGCCAGYDNQSGDNNTLIGQKAGHNITTGYKNVMIGFEAGGGNSTGYCNVYLGPQAAGGFSAGRHNFIAGYQAGYTGSSASHNFIIGQLAFNKVCSSDNVAIGEYAGYQYCNNNGSDILIGKYINYLTSGGGRNVMLGRGIVSGGWPSGGHSSNVCDNVVLGYEALKCATTPCRNTIVGSFAGKYMTTGKCNVLIGYGATATATGDTQLAIGIDNSNWVSGDSSFNVTLAGIVTAYATTGIVSATKFCGDGSGLSNVPGFSQDSQANLYAGTGAGAASDADTCCNIGVGCNALKSLNEGDLNIAIGHETGCSLTSGLQHLLIGCRAGASLTTCYKNTFVGHGAGQNSTTAVRNTFIGFEAGKYNVTGSCNIYMGNYTARCACAGDNNIAIGNDALCGSTTASANTGSSNIAIGQITLHCVSSGSCNIALSKHAGCAVTTGSNNIFLGLDAGKSATTGANNIAIGHCAAGKCATTGNCNISIGVMAGMKLTSGTCNVFIGECAGKCNDTYTRNTFIGSRAGHYACGNDNAYIGWGAGRAIVGDYNIFMGRYAGKAGSNSNTHRNSGLGLGSFCNIDDGCCNTGVGQHTGNKVTSGSNNVFLGSCSGYYVTTGDYNVLIGAGTSAPSATGDTQMAIGAGSANWITGDSNFNVGIGTNRHDTVVGVAVTAKLSVGIVSAYQLYGDGSNLTGLAGFSPDSYENLVAGTDAGKCLSSNDTCNVLIGYNAGCNIGDSTDDDQNVMIGFNAGKASKNSNYEVYIGSNAGCAGDGTAREENVFIGRYAGSTNCGGCANVYIGRGAGQNRSCGNYNVIFGKCAGQCGRGANNVMIGHSAGRGSCNTCTGANNVLIGYSAASCITSGNLNTVVGCGAVFDITSGSNNTIFGNRAGENLTTGGYNNFFGSRTAAGGAVTGSHNFSSGLNALNSLTSGSGNVAIGENALACESAGLCNIAIGHDAMLGSDGGDCNVALGTNAGKCITTGDVNVFIGHYAGRAVSTGAKNIFIGDVAGGLDSNLKTGNYNVALGGCVGRSLSSGGCNILLGIYAGDQITTGGSNIAIGRCAMSACAVTGGSNIALGRNAGKKVTSGERNVFLGHYAGSDTADNNYTGTESVFVGAYAGQSSTGQYQTFIGTNAGKSFSCGKCNVALGYAALKGASASSTGCCNIAIGICALANVTTGGDNYFIGKLAGLCVKTGSKNIAIGICAGRGSHTNSDGLTGNYNIFFGRYTGYNLETASGNILIGDLTGRDNTTSCNNVAIGRCSNRYNTTGGNNVLLGSKAGCGSSGNSTFSNTVLVGHGAGEGLTSGSKNIFLGYQAGNTNTSGSANVAIGYDVELPSATGDNQFAIGCGTSRWITGDSSFDLVTNNIVPSSNNSKNLGSDATRWANIYTNDLQLSNKGKTNDVDGTWGDFTIQEGENDLFLINNRSGKKYKFNLTEVS